MDESIISETNKNNNESNDNHSQNNIKSHRVITIRAALFPVDKLWDHKNWNMTIGECTIRKRMNCLHPQLIFYTSWFCPFAQRTWITLEESNVKYKWIEINPYEVDPNEPGGYTKKSLSIEMKQKLYPNFIKASPRGLVPAIQHESSNKDTKTVYLHESIMTSEYINKVYSNSTLIPNDPYQYSIMQIWIDHITNRIQKEFYSALMLSTAVDNEYDINRRNQHIKQCYDECNTLSNAMIQHSGQDGPYFFGKHFTLFDIMFIPFYQRMLIIGVHYIPNFIFPPKICDERFTTWWNAVKVRKSVSCTFVNKQRLICTYKQYSNNIATSDYAHIININNNKRKAN